MSEKTIYDCERAKFEGFGTYKLPIEERVNEIIEATKKEYRLAAAGRLRPAVALELSPGLMWAAGRLGPRDIGDGLRSPQ